MENADPLIRALYALAVEEDWGRFRSLALERVCTAAGASIGAWLTQATDQAHPGEFTTWPADAPVTAQTLQALPLREEQDVAIGVAQLLPGTGQGRAMKHAHLDSRLASRVALWFALPPKIGGGPVLRSVVGHMVEAGALALQHFILADERLSRWGRTNRGTAAMVDARGTVYAASRAFRELLGAEFGSQDFDRLPFRLPDETHGGHGSFSHGSLRFRAVRTDAVRYLIYARKAQPLDGLSPREQEIARALAAGKTFKSVARQCGIATSTVANHASRIYRKLGIYRREELFEMIRSAGAASRTGPRTAGDAG